MRVSAAEVLQVREADLLLIGDQNRTYSVRLACAEINPGQEQNSIDFLRKQLPRRQKVNLMPMGSKDGLLLARVRPLGSSQDLSSLLVENQLAKLNQGCIKATNPMEKA
ncbi:nuclease [Synechococcus lacustris]|uniref:nuclease n=1 Tax=Synechococcus lacustris TaxID=2116544 RepID=UPI0028F3FC2D|nr:nuclease [Synechococcus lacustris]